MLTRDKVQTYSKVLAVILIFSCLITGLAMSLYNMIALHYYEGGSDQFMHPVNYYKSLSLPYACSFVIDVVKDGICPVECNTCFENCTDSCQYKKQECDAYFTSEKYEECKRYPKEVQRITNGLIILILVNVCLAFIPLGVWLYAGLNPRTHPL